MSKENEAVILSAVRTPIARFQGGLSSIPATKLGAVVVKEAVKRAGIENKEDIDEVFMGMVVPAGQGQAPARQAAIFAGLPATVSATTFNKVCGSGLKTAMLVGASHQSRGWTVVRSWRHGIHDARALPGSRSHR